MTDETRIPQSLRGQLQAGKVIPFVGAGVSMAVRGKDGQRLFPSWKALLLRGADRLDREQRQDHARIVRSLLEIDQPEYLNAARRLREQLGPIWFGFLKEQIDVRPEQVAPASLALARAVWELGSKLVLTTNYDRVLRWACPDRFRQDLSTWDIQATVEQRGLLRDGQAKRPTIWHLHGRIRNAAELILTPDGYQHLYPSKANEERYRAALATLREQIASRSLLFIGFSLDDQHFGVELRGVADLFDGDAGPHYVLVRENEKARRWPAGVVPVPFADFGPPLVSLVEELGRFTEAATEATVPAEAAIASPVPPAQQPGEAPAVVDRTPGAAPFSLDNRPFFVPFVAKGERVIGRDRALLAVHEQLTQGRPTAIGQTASFQGLGGLGKTQLAVEYAWRYSEEYAGGVVWLNADQDIEAQLTRLAVEAKWVAPQTEHRQKLEVALHRLRSTADCLIVYDNLEQLEAIEPYLPHPGVKAHLLVTSRTGQAGFMPIDLPLLNAEQSLAMLMEEAGRVPQGAEEEQAARAIAGRLNGLPLALELAGAYLLYRSLSWGEYLRILDSSLGAALPRKLASFTGHEADLFATLKVQEAVLAGEPHLREILDLLTWSAPVNMGLSLMSASLATEETALLGPLALGRKLRLLNADSEGRRFGIHRLVRQVRQQDVPLAEHRDRVEAWCRRLGDWFALRRQDFADLPVFEAEIDHLRTWHDHALEYARSQASQLAWLRGYPPFHRGRYHRAQDWVSQAIELFSREGLVDPGLEAWLWNDLGVTWYSLGDFHKALEYGSKALEIRRRTIGGAHSDTATSLNNIGSAYRLLGEYEKALECHQKALGVHKKALGEYHRDTAISLSNIGTAYHGLGKYEKALEWHQKALEVRQKVLGEQHPDTADSFNSIGNVCGSTGKHEEALQYYEKDLALSQRVLGEQHPDTAVSVNNTASALLALGRRQEAFDLLDPFLKNLPENHSEAERLHALRKSILKKPLRPGFRQPSMKKKAKRKKRKRRK